MLQKMIAILNNMRCSTFDGILIDQLCVLFFGVDNYSNHQFSLCKSLLSERYEEMV